MWRFLACFYLHIRTACMTKACCSTSLKTLACCGCFCFWVALSLPETPQQTCTECLATPCTRTHPVRPADALGAAQTSVERANPEH